MRAPLILALLMAMLAPSTMAAPPAQNVLVIYGYGRLLPGNIEADRGLRETVAGQQDGRVTLFEEFLDEPQFTGDAYRDTIVQYLRGKYRSLPPDVIVAVGPEALGFVLQTRAALFPGVPVVHAGIAQHALPPLPSGVVGVPVDFEVFRTMVLALRLHPAARRLVVVTGASSVHDRRWEGVLRADAARLDGRVSVEFLAGLSHGAVLQRLRGLGRDAVVLTVGYLEDGEGRSFRPVDAVRDMARVSTAPIYAPYETFIGQGVVGGYTRTFRMQGQDAGNLVNAVLAGADLLTLRRPTAAPASLQLDAQQLDRWRIDPKAIPAGAVVRFKSPTFWEHYRLPLTIGLFILLLQGGLISWLLRERFRRRHAEHAVETQRFELAHVSRLAMAGELTAAIAHEINQPLGAILSNADAAEMILGSGSDRQDELRAILADIRRDDLRASEVIRRLRTLLARHEVERRPLDVNAVVADAVAAVRGEASRRGVALESRPAPVAVVTQGDAIQLQQVLINLLLNSMDAVKDLPAERQAVSISVARRSDLVVVTVRDRGHGIKSDDLPRLFDSFFTTKRQGMGLGLSIARTIVESQGGRVWAENEDEGGATFWIELPAIDDTPPATSPVDTPAGRLPLAASA